MSKPKFSIETDSAGHGFSVIASFASRFNAAAYLSGMSKAYEFALPVLGTKVPAGDRWIHEVKHDGYRLRVERGGKKVRLISKGASTSQIATRGLPRPRFRTAPASSSSTGRP